MGSLGNEASWPTRFHLRHSQGTDNHHVGLRERNKDLQGRSHGKHHRGEGDHQETTKAAAWAVFQHHGGGGHTYGSAVRRATRFRIEAQMKHEIAHRSVSDTVAPSWDAGSTLFDSFELDSLLKQLDQASNPGGVQEDPSYDEADEGKAMVVFSQKHPRPNPYSDVHPSRSLPQHFISPNHGHGGQLLEQEVEDGFYLRTSPYPETVHEMHILKVQGKGHGQLAGSYQNPEDIKGRTLHDELQNAGHDATHGNARTKFHGLHTPHLWNVRKSGRQSFDSSRDKVSKGDHRQRSRWKNLLHNLRLDGFHTQVAPHDSHRKAFKGRSHRLDHKNDSRSHNVDSDTRYFDGKDLHVSKDVHPPCDKHDHRDRSHPHLPYAFKFGLKMVLPRPFCRTGHLLSEGEDSDREETCNCQKQEGQKHDVQSAWHISLTGNHHHQHGHQSHEKHEFTDDQQPELEKESHHEHHHHYHHHHHHIQPEDEDYELTVQAISRRVPRKSFEEKVRRLSIEDSGMKAPRNSLEYFEDRTVWRSPWEAESSLKAE